MKNAYYSTPLPVRTMKFRYLVNGKYMYFSLPYMSKAMWKGLQDPRMDDVTSEQCFIFTTWVYGEPVNKEVWK